MQRMRRWNARRRLSVRGGYFPDVFCGWTALGRGGVGARYTGAAGLTPVTVVQKALFGAEGTLLAWLPTTVP